MQQQGENSTLPVATSSNTQPTILIFDSGVGGLSVYDEIRQLLPNLNYIYTFDNQGFPYGEKPEQFIVQRVVQIAQAVNRDYPLDLIVIACNTASTISLPELRKHFAIPIVGVVPAVKPAAQISRNGIIGLLATRATISRPYTFDLIKQFANDCQVRLLGSARLVEMAEEKLHGEQIDLAELKAVVAEWLTDSDTPDTIVLGCTHFPLLKVELAQVLPVGTQLVDSGAAVARRVKSLLKDRLNNHSNCGLQHLVLCTQLDHQARKLLPVLQQYGFNQLKQLVLNPIQ